MQNSAGKQDHHSPQVRRISVVGPSGSGKSVLSRTLAERLSLPHVELDPIRQAHASDAEFIRLVTALTADSGWVIDGHYRLVRDIIWRRANTIVWLNYPLGFVLVRLAGRFAAKMRGASAVQPVKNSNGSDRAPPASWARRFGRLARTVRERREYRELLGEAVRRGAMLVELRSETEARAWLGSLPWPRPRDEPMPEGPPSC